MAIENIDLFPIHTIVFKKCTDVYVEVGCNQIIMSYMFVFFNSTCKLVLLCSAFSFLMNMMQNCLSNKTVRTTPIMIASFALLGVFVVVEVRTDRFGIPAIERLRTCKNIIFVDLN